jgi:hypothetical protein
MVGKLTIGNFLGTQGSLHNSPDAAIHFPQNAKKIFALRHPRKNYAHLGKIPFAGAQKIHSFRTVRASLFES